MASDADCVFCRIVAGGIPAEVVRETERTLAFPDVSPQAPVHVLVIPKDHRADLDAVVADDPELAGELLRECAAVADHLGVREAGYRVVTNIGAQGGQGVFHCHLHVLAGRQMSDALG
ncbi:histidine triad nucleotide-binding protein [Actinopolymorpha singaporensis]|uniref:Histidine triad (HIT) family protein n=1 Tax=Actinopolymorpha singaporensis TaxID=117157 RepID=A0A1H1UCM6_9ACTN|nr:histidine triad nucleotide-binding protein [Actinopolymorpha singaporensis]SDS70252.1 histidine triad (HIT) family protein [Actinopolymorpha singaporensis]